MELGLTEFDEKIRCGRGILLCGTDEAGRGPLAGPVFAAAVILPERVEIKGLGDSKKLSPKKRETLFTEICEKALAFSVCSASVFEIEEINIQNASLLAMSRAVNSLKCRDGGVIAPDLVLVDGNLARGFEYPAEAVIGGDERARQSRPPRFSRRYQGTRIWQSLISSIRNTALRATRATAQKSIMRLWRDTARARSTGCRF